MLYLYTLYMLAWDLDKDTHAYFRKYLEVFINKRKISKGLRDLLGNNRPIGMRSTCQGKEGELNILRVRLPNRIRRSVSVVVTFDPGWIRRNVRSPIVDRIYGSMDLVLYQGGRMTYKEYPQCTWTAPIKIDDIHRPKIYFEEMEDDQSCFDSDVEI